MYGATNLPKFTPSTPPVKKLPTGGAPAAVPSGRSTAGQMVQNSRSRARSNVPHAPARRGGGGGRSPAYNPLESPYKTQGQFNQAVSRTAQAAYQPELDNFTREEGAEGGLHAQREGTNSQIYTQYSEQAQAAFDRAKAALAEIASRQNAGTDAAQKALQAALSNTGVAGVQGVQNPNDFMGEAAGFGKQSSQTLAGIQGANINEAANAQLIPGAWRNEAQSAEGQRNQGELAKIKEGRSKVLANIPNIQAKVRGELSKQEQERQTNALQAQIAGKKIGLEERDVAGKRKGEKEQIGAKRAEAREANSIKLEEMSQNAGFKWAEIDVQRKDLATKAAEARNGREKATAELMGKRFDHGIEIMHGYLKKNDKTEYQPTGVPATDQGLAENGKKTPFHKDANTLYQQLTKGGNLTAPEAFRIMEFSGNGYVEQFAREHKATYEQEENRRKLGGPIKTLPKVPAKGKTLPTLRQPTH